MAASLWVSAAAQRGVPAAEGIDNFGKVDEGLYRGAQPDASGIQNLKRLGIKTIINLRLTDEVWQPEAATARLNGMAYTNVPLSGIRRPAEERIRKILALIDTLPGPVFIHCQYGCDRTGTVIACYHIQHDHWSSAAALREASHYGMSSLARGMKQFVLDFEKRTKSQPP